MKSKIISTILGMLVAITVASAVIGFINHKKQEDISPTAQSVCLTSGYDNWYKVVHNRDGSYKVWCFNNEWRVVTFEM